MYLRIQSAGCSSPLLIRYQQLFRPVTSLQCSPHLSYYQDMFGVQSLIATV